MNEKRGLSPTIHESVQSDISLMANSRSLGKRIVPWAFALFAGVLAVLANLNYAGYCLAESKVLSDAEKIQRAVGYLLKDYPPSNICEHVTPTVLHCGRPKAPTFFYKSPEQLIKFNSNCCSVKLLRQPEEGTVGTINRLMGTWGYAQIDYIVRYQEDGVEKSALSKNSITISNCGKPVD